MTSHPDPTPVKAAPQAPQREFTVVNQKVELEIDFVTRCVLGRTCITILPRHKDLRTIQLNCRQAVITRLTVEGRGTSVGRYEDPYRSIPPRPQTTVHQFHQVQSKLHPQLQYPPASELWFNIPKSVQIQQQQAEPEVSELTPYADDNPEVSGAAAQTHTEKDIEFIPLVVEIGFTIAHARDGLQFVGCEETDGRYPHVYTRNSSFAGAACALFPCIDDVRSRHPIDLSVTCARTLGDAFKRSTRITNLLNLAKASAAPPNGQEGAETPEYLALNDEERAMDLHVLGSGDMTDEIVNETDPSRKTTHFSCGPSVSPNQIGFAIGPFEEVDLSKFREVGDDEKLGENATHVHGYCLPGRAAEVRNTCMPLAKAIDFCTTTFTTFPFPSYKLCFVDDLEPDIADTAGLAICSNRLLFPEDIIDPMDSVTRKLVRAVTTQYAGICVAPYEPSDSWAVIGLAGFMADLFMKSLCGNNEYRYQQKLAANRVCELDVDRLSMFDLGKILHLDKTEAEFLSLKAGVVMFILDRRFAKTGTAGLTRIVTRTLSDMKTATGEDTMLQTAAFQRRCEKMNHGMKLESFFDQWVHGAGCPIFDIAQQFNKKKLSIQVTINQRHVDAGLAARELNPKTFMRDVKEEAVELYVPPPRVFTGPMTIRIHEADGTPYEHIVEIRDKKTSIEIPYNTKYKRLRRSRKAKERAATNTTTEEGGEAQEDSLLYCLGDTLQSAEEFAEWRLADWSPDDDAKMNSEAYEWIRVDADFEWIATVEFKLNPWMFASQLQQDRDVVAQYETLQYLEKLHTIFPVAATMLIRTIMDHRYFHGIRTKAASLLTKAAKDETDWLGLFLLEKAFSELFCYPGTGMTRPNDFSDRKLYLLQCALIKAIANIKDNSGYSPTRVKRFFIDKLKFNDNSLNDYSDNYYISTLMSGLAETLIRPKEYRGLDDLTEEDEEEEEMFKKEATDEIQRYRRIDEWISSYHNVYTLTALDCLQRLASAGVIKPNLADFLQYTRIGNADLVRVKAFDCLRELGQMKNPVIIRYFLFNYSAEKSPYVRGNMVQVFGHGLGQIAITEKLEDTTVITTGRLIIENESSTQDRQAEFARKQTVEGATAALKAELENNETLKQALWSAVRSTKISLHEVIELLDLCSMLYEKETSFLVKLDYPRYWQVERLDGAVLKFSKTDRIRTTPRIPSQPPPAVENARPAPATVPALPSVLPQAPSPAPLPVVTGATAAVSSPAALPESSITAMPPPRASPAASRRQSSVGAHNAPATSSASPSPAVKSNVVKLKFKKPQATQLPNPTPSIADTGPRLSIKLGGNTSSVNDGPQIKNESATSPPPLLSQGHQTMSPPPRPSSAASASSDSSTALAVTAAARSNKRKSTEPQDDSRQSPVKRTKTSASPDAPTPGHAAAAARSNKRRSTEPQNDSRQSPVKKTKTSASPDAPLPGYAAPTIASKGKKQKSSDSNGTAQDEQTSQQPPPKKPMLKLRLSGTGLGGASSGSQTKPPPPPPSG